MKRERVCQFDDKATPALRREAGVTSDNGRRDELSPLAILHGIFGRIPEKIRHLAGERVYRSVYSEIHRDSKGVREKADPAPGVIVCGCSGCYIGIDQRSRVHHTINAGWWSIASLCISRCVLLGVSGTTDCDGEQEQSHGKSCSPHR